MQQSPLHLAVMRNDLQAVSDAQNAGYTPFNTSDDITPFDLALIAVANNNQTSKLILQLLLISGCSATTTNAQDETLLTLACESGYGICIPTLCKSGADINIVSGKGMTPLGSAAQHGYVEIVKLLVAQGADVNKLCPAEGCTPMAIVTMPSVITRSLTKMDDRLEIYKRLKEHGGEEHFTQYSTADQLLLPNGMDVLQIACMRNDATKVRHFIEHGAPLDVERSDGLTPLIVASASGFDEIVKMLLSYGSYMYLEDVHFQNLKHALTMACKMKHFNISAMLMKVILKKGHSQLPS